MSNAFFSDLLTSIAERGRNLLDGRSWSFSEASVTAADVLALCGALLSGRGEATGAVIARETLDAFARLPEAARKSFFEVLAREFGPDQAQLERAVEAFRLAPDGAAASRLHYMSEPRRQELFRRLNRAPGGTKDLVAMRVDLLKICNEVAEFALIDADFVHLFNSWFNPGFLVLRHIDWGTPANILEKIIRYEAVHQIHDWDDLRRRIDPKDRRCYAFFHPALIDEPLIFVEVALTAAMPDNIQGLLAADRALEHPEKARTAVFYSISNCQQGLSGVSFGNFLIKQVVEELRRELPHLDQFVTLSPVPGFMKWLSSGDAPPISRLEQALRDLLMTDDWLESPEKQEAVRRALEPMAAEYFLKAKSQKGRPVDPVARFHLGNGARLERINWLGDRSPKGLRESAGIMVNYLYDLEEIEANHEAFLNKGEVVAASAVKKLLRGDTRSMFSRQSPSGPVATT
ncbi:malonyl-CoA decarboxylase [Rhodoblastus acidophilus]|uniref:Malonyl-CoA decarboxylase n=1 Tax=Candidatus Rhodoblastus alkanivorans TaxID=2954117 RepID=A0ABS9Z1A9_9HYPH|nr:malonyl-CoA decarboxylase [Candidatus Rhodoblastus alkanivorans]MCI4679423.1 malonyl-CoA decarboxylase [Candidatus Rhodoblastus alkanivorans]MCI4681431.1 malonyl-CoA decarboxylase [Candidatus Rhodoblastus alkanivorans]MDI4642479.1 malonyl-CoA decarboxylase [Rhodoblastus acidophilus]